MEKRKEIEKKERNQEIWFASLIGNKSKEEESEAQIKNDKHKKKKE